MYDLDKSIPSGLSARRIQSNQLSIGCYSARPQDADLSLKSSQRAPIQVLDDSKLAQVPQRSLSNIIPKIQESDGLKNLWNRRKSNLDGPRSSRRRGREGLVDQDFSK